MYSNTFYANVDTFAVTNTGTGYLRLLSASGLYDDLYINLQNPLYPTSTASTNSATPPPWDSSLPLNWCTTNNPLGKSMCTGIKNQGFCAACWAFAASEVLESSYAMSHGGITPVEMSHQEITTCAIKARSDSSDPCGGGYVRKGLGFGLTYGMQSASYYNSSWNTQAYVDYPPVVGSCPSNISASVEYNFPDYCKYASSNTSTILSYLAKYGPAVIDIDASNWFNLGSYMIDSTSICSASVSAATHTPVLVGWDQNATTGQKYWIVRNQWGEDWVFNCNYFN